MCLVIQACTNALLIFLLQGKLGLSRTSKRGNTGADILSSRPVYKHKPVYHPLLVREELGPTPVSIALLPAVPNVRLTTTSIAIGTLARPIIQTVLRLVYCVYLTNYLSSSSNGSIASLMRCASVSLMDACFPLASSESSTCKSLSSLIGLAIVLSSWETVPAITTTPLACSSLSTAR